jgi:serine/threonine protein phosphatase PrpC
VLTKLHRPEDPEETELIKNRGGSIYFYNGAWRVNATLSVSRSLGDYSCRQYITCEPEVVVHNIDYSQDEFLVVASDGLWDYMSPEEVVAFVQQCRHEVDDARAARLLQQNGLASDSDNEDGTSSESMQNYAIVTAALVDEALQKGSSDNVSCVIVHFQNGLATVSS